MSASSKKKKPAGQPAEGPDSTSPSAGQEHASGASAATAADPAPATVREVVRAAGAPRMLDAHVGVGPVAHRRGKSGAWRLIRFLALLFAFLYATGTIRAIRESLNGRFWTATHPEPSTYEWMNASAFAEGGKTSSVLKRMIFPRPLRGPKQLLVKVIKAAGNPVDFKMRKNPRYPLKLLPAISGLDFAGYVAEADETSPFKVGQRVFGMLPTSSPRWGTFAEYVVIDEEFTAIVPEGVSFSEAAATPLAALTAIQALANIGPVVQNETILIHAGSGGVGTFAIQFAKKILGLQVYTTSTNVELCQSLGADRVINYRTEKFEKVLPKFDYVIDMIGGDYFFRSVPMTRKHYASVLNNGWEDYFGFEEMILPGEMLSNLFINIAHYVTFGRYPKYSLTIVNSDGKALAVIGDLIKRGVVKVVLDEEFTGLDDGPRKLHDRLQSGRAKGKLTLAVAAD